MACELCDFDGGTVLWRDQRARVVLVDDADYSMFCRVIWNTHVKEMTDLPEADRHSFLRIVFAVEQTLRNLLNPAKMNLASLGNQTPHLHWHVIPRFSTDRHFPRPVWAEPMRTQQETAYPRVSEESLKRELSKTIAKTTANTMAMVSGGALQ